jgi:hypothetical protein
VQTNATAATMALNDSFNKNVPYSFNWKLDFANHPYLCKGLNIFYTFAIYSHHLSIKVIWLVGNFIQI